jgi:hypothetical protein
LPRYYPTAQQGSAAWHEATLHSRRRRSVRIAGRARSDEPRAATSDDDDCAGPQLCMRD